MSAVKRRIPLGRLWVPVVALAFTFLVVPACMWFVDNRIPAFSKNCTVWVYPESTVDEVIEAIVRNASPRFPSSIRRVFARENVTDSNIKPGCYRIRTDDKACYVARAMRYGWQNPINITLSGCMRTKAEIAHRLSSQLLLDSLTVLNALNDSAKLAVYGTTPAKVYGMILPDTYQMYWNVTIDELLERFRMEYDKYWNEERLAAAQKQGLTREEVSVLASIVAQESAIPDEYPKIASVYLTRLRKGMKLQACPTVCFIYGYSIRRVLYRHLENPSPYNTYVHTGLPPAPICTPEKVHLEAVLHPSETPYLFFCADPDFNGRNVFSRTYAEHQANSAAYHKAFVELMAKKEAEAQKNSPVLPEGGVADEDSI